jgi:DNA-binding CsgD family transcriptional regulator
MENQKKLNVRKSDRTKAKAHKYFVMGLNSKEIGKILDLSFRTVQSYMSQDDWHKKQKPANLKFEALKLYEFGKSYNEIAELLNVSRTSVYLYLKETRTYTKTQKAKHILKK